uniref:CSON000237 protein n=1 Tax=Culicoides sonorensis TaxID=179676 RepID=A0A336MDS2_CULSO
MNRTVILILFFATFVTSNPISREHIKLNCSQEHPYDVSTKSEAITVFKIHYSKIPKLNLTNICLAFPNLYRIYIRDSAVEEITPDSFNACVNAILIDLLSNKIKQLDVNLFKNNEKLAWLDFENNQLKQIPNQIFNNLKKLFVLILSNNKLINLDDELIDSINENCPEIRSIYWRGNKFKCERLEEIKMKYKELRFLRDIDRPWDCVKTDYESDEYESIEFDELEELFESIKFDKSK